MPIASVGARFSSDRGEVGDSRQSVLFYLALVTFVGCLGLALQMLHGNRQLVDLKRVAPLEEGLPTLTVIVAARNEARHIEDALRSLLRLDYPGIRLIAVNDRSTDGTGAILDRLADEDDRLFVHHVETLPAGWLGKNHALWSAAETVDTDLILFTDADVTMEPSAVRRAVQYLESQQIDHLPMLFHVQMPNWLLKVFVIGFSVVFFSWFRPWKASDPNSPAHVGAGGFNLIRTSAYRQIGTYQAIRLRPDDDVKLGKLVKQHGFRQEMVVAPDFLSVPWYSTLGEAIRGLEKNTFSGVDYRAWLVVASSAIAFTWYVLPFVAVFFTNGWTRGFYLGSVVSLWAMSIDMAWRSKLPISAALAFPLSMALLIFIMWRTMILNIWQGGIRWRDTFYPLAELKSNKV